MNLIKRKTIECPDCKGLYIDNKSICPHCNKEVTPNHTSVVPSVDPEFGIKLGIINKHTNRLKSKYVYKTLRRGRR